MPVDKKHLIHSRGGRLGEPDISTLQDVDAIVDELAHANHLILHFHGGLVSSTAGLKIAAKLLPTYHDSVQGLCAGDEPSVVEEITRSFKVTGSSVNEWGKALQWNRMKQDCDDAFLDDTRAGTALLRCISSKLDGGRKLPRITLVGHSTGAVYICA